MAERLQRLVAWVGRHAPAVVGGVVVLAVAAGLFAALTLHPDSSTSTLVGRSTETYQATKRLHDDFGDDSVIVLVRESVPRLVLTADVQRVLGLEGCLSGNLPPNVKAPGGPDGPCARLAKTKPIRVVYGPGTFINESVRQISDEFSAQSTQKQAEAQRAGQAAYSLARGKGIGVAQAKKYGEQARQLVYAQFTRDVLQLALKYGLKSAPRLNDPQFVSSLVFDGSKAPGTPKARFAYLFPNSHAAIVQLRPKPGLTQDQREEMIRQVRRAVRMPQWRLHEGGSYVVTGAPVVVSDLSSRISHALVVLLIAAMIVMAATLALVFRTAPRLLPLLVAVCAASITFGLLAVAGAPLTMAVIGVLPVLLGLAVDYAIQFQSRARAEGVAAAARRSGPTLVTAGAATAAGFLVLALSPVPQVREFGLLLVAGVLIALVCAFTLGAAVLHLVERREARGGGEGRLGASLAGAGRGAEDLVLRNPAARWVGERAGRAAQGAISLALHRPQRVLLVAVLVAVAGWAVDTQQRVESDITKLVPQDLPALRDLQSLQRSTGVGGEIDVTVQSRDLTDPKVLAWMTSYQQRLLKRYGYSDKAGCGKATLCPAFSLPDLFSSGGGTPTQAGIRALLDAVPPYFSQAVITGDRKTATLAFGIRLMPLARQQDVIDAMRADLHPPSGVKAELAGLPVLAAAANEKVSSSWRRVVQLLVGLLAVALVLLIALRRPSRALVPLVPIALATGWSALVLFATRVPLNPMSVTLGALVIAISTEFSVLLSERYRQEREEGWDEGQALARTYASTGAAVLASGSTAVAGFAVLVISDIAMLRNFGLVTVVDLTVSLLGVLVVLPSVLVLAGRGELVPRRLRRAARGRRAREPGPAAA